jgi:alpha-L-fucosidase
MGSEKFVDKHYHPQFKDLVNRYKPDILYAGDRNFNLCKQGDSYTTADYIIRQTIGQERGMAVKELFFTENDSAIFAISPKWPGEKLLIKDIQPAKNSKITLLGVDGNLAWKQAGKNIEIELPTYNPNWNVSDYAYTFKIEMK